MRLTGVLAATLVVSVLWGEGAARSDPPRSSSPDQGGKAGVDVPLPTLTIVLDPGHGGHNGGCVGFDGRTREKDVALMLVRDLEAAIVQRIPHARVLLTRTEDRSLPLDERVAIANERGADLFISIHANASPSRTQAGFETYVLDATATAKEAARSAQRAREPSGELGLASGMVRELELARQRTLAIAFAAAVQREQAERFPQRIDRGVKQAPFDVLLGPNMPAVLFEAAFLDNPDDAWVVIDPSARLRVIDGLVEALVEFARLRHRAG